MSAHALALVLTAAVLHATWNIAAKRVEGGGYVFVFSYALLSAVIWLPIGFIVLASTNSSLTWSLIWAALLSGVFHIAYGLTLQTGYNKAELGVVYPVARGTGPLLTMIFAIVVLAERPGWLGVLGGVIVITGVVVVASARPPASEKKPRHRASSGILWGGLTGVMIASYTLWDDHSMTALALAPVPYFAFSTAWQSIGLLPGMRGRGADLRAVSRRYWREIVCVALLSPLAYVLVLIAMQTTPVALVAPARESSIVIGSLLAWRLFHEPRPARKFLGAVVVLAGIALIAA
ncbi:DMT family transporter [Rudaeicoccus suwonensis]|uniref:EamA-like transporter family protein n=1 Tax=Rudaeicoccus suwonensis TaxID=657409 RepID=A0A561E7L1_9MICO|nr:DMT family transporter [Rudaeicoccus suwonensis]TWE11596.1 EamA-like transporter family protein [Rudaeicoccus suwonensis]